MLELKNINILKLEQTFMYNELINKINRITRKFEISVSEDAIKFDDIYVFLHFHFFFNLRF